MRRWIFMLPLATGCMAGFGEQRTDETEVEGDVLEISLVATSGDVQVRVVPGRTVGTITRTVRWNGDAPCLKSSLEAGLLALTDDCGSGVACAVDYVITLPASPDFVSVDTGSGDVGVDGLEGDVVVKTGSGDVTLAGIGGDVNVDTGSGDILGHRLTSTAFLGDTGSGDVDLTFDVAPLQVDVGTGSGDVTLAVPAGTYRVETSTGSGDVSLSGIEEGDGGTLHVETGSGDIVIDGR